jgi:nitroimidazol reductase NimA-like FMN-containing flavoprotein (pyridoxamine 5'-phosphate oxidase superfamily)
MSTLQTERTTVKRIAKRALYDRDTMYAILDEAVYCHVGFVVDGAPVVIPTIHWREGDTLYLHGSAANRMLRTLRDGVDACVTVTLLDGLVIARSGFHHSLNYRSVVIMGKAFEVTEREEKLRQLDLLVEHVIPGRTADARPANEAELKRSMVLRLPIEEGSAKVRTGGPNDDAEDMSMPIWAGVLPLRMVPEAPITAEGVPFPVPDYVSRWRR